MKPSHNVQCEAHMVFKLFCGEVMSTVHKELRVSMRERLTFIGYPLWVIK